MEPGHEDREYGGRHRAGPGRKEPQWSPVMKTGNTTGSTGSDVMDPRPQWSPVMKTGNTSCMSGLRHVSW